MTMMLVDQEEYEALRRIEEAAWRYLIGSDGMLVFGDYPALLHELRVLYDIREERARQRPQEAV